MENKKFLFFYLNTGAGHVSAAKVLSSAIQKEDPSCQIKMINGFRPHKLGHFIFERGYKFSVNYFKGAFPLTYELGQHTFFQSLLKHLLGPETRPYLRKIILKERPTDIVCFHFAVTPFIKDVLKNIPWKINFTVIVTDPFTVPYSWFYEKNITYMVYSEEAKNIGVHECNVPSENITVIPFLMDEKFHRQINTEEKKALRKKLGFDPNKKMVLLVGGGEGLPGATEIINNCISNRADFAITVICGRDKVKMRNLKVLRLAHPKLDLHIYGFVNNLDELVKICDCAVIKAGPATLMEVLSCRKPVIICKYIHNQELGNMHFAVKNKVGYFIRQPRKIYKKINYLLNDSQFDEKMKERFESVVIDTDSNKVAKILLGK